MISYSLSVTFSSSESENEMRISTAHNILSMFRPRSKSEQDKLELLSNLCRIYSKEPKEVKRAMLELTDMQAKNVRHDFINTVTAALVSAFCPIINRRFHLLCYLVFNPWRL